MFVLLVFPKETVLSGEQVANCYALRGAGCKRTSLGLSALGQRACGWLYVTPERKESSTTPCQSLVVLAQVAFPCENGRFLANCAALSGCCLLEQRFSTSALLTVWTEEFFVVRNCPVHSRMFGSIPGPNPPRDSSTTPPSMTITDVFRGAWVAQSVEHLTSAEVMTSRFMSSSPTSGSMLTTQSLEPVSDSVSPSLSGPPDSHCVSLSQINK